MRKFLLVSHGGLAEGIKNSVEMISGKHQNLYSICMHIDESPESIKGRVQSFIQDNKDDELILVSDFPGGSINTMLMSFINLAHVYLLSGMNTMLVLSLVLSQNHIEECLNQAIKEGRKTIKRIEVLNDEEEDNFFD